MQLLSILVPPRLDFYRQPIEVAPVAAPAPAPVPASGAEAHTSRKARQPSASSAAADLLAARSMPSKPVAVAASASSIVAIYGSVSAADVAIAVKAVLAANDEAARIVFADEDVKFVNVTVDGQALAETDKIKHIGEFEAEIRIKGAEAAVKKIVRVLPQESST